MSMIRALLDFPNGLIQILEFLRDGRDLCNGAIVGDDFIPHIFIPRPQGDEILYQVFVDHSEFTGENPTDVDIRGDGPETLDIA